MAEGGKETPKSGGMSIFNTDTSTTDVTTKVRTRTNVLKEHEQGCEKPGVTEYTEKNPGVATKKRGVTPDDGKNSPIPYKTRHTVARDSVHNVSYVTFDIETGGLDYRTSDLLQISAVCGTDEFDVYVSPERSNIEEGASKVNKLSIVQGTLHYKGDAVNSINIKDALEKFIDFLENVHKPVLVGHNIKKFDVPFISFYLKRYSLWERSCGTFPS